ncbi:hypothetical protein UA08_02122 [Talaromyces atroroseus]|uniref:C2H2-type domain-containing protein n=1 Tax=Talaromyces atroroseus TaxID=1441469 RepID=A0A1Q5QA91_TALAT|nr:hypothetical protein UA08_02122 [Talaromyces atroroseus]OKL62863.1 hypothetical protein UA08_02122 [Talaromyces atroroseus]
MQQRGFTNPAPKTDSARSALSSFTCTLCNKSYSRHPEYEAHIGSYDHQHRKRLQDLKQLSRDPNAAERARKAERKADAEAGLVRVNNNNNNNNSSNATATSSTGASGGGFKKGGFKSSFTAVKGPAAVTPSVKKNVLRDDDDDDNDGNDGVSNFRASTTSGQHSTKAGAGAKLPHKDTRLVNDGESDTDDDYGNDDNTGEAYYSPLKPTGCFPGCEGAKAVPATS